MNGLTFPEFMAVMRPTAIVFPPPFVPSLNAADMVDQCALIKELFGGRWPSRG